MIWVHVDGEIHHRHRSGALWSDPEIVTDTDGKTQSPALAADPLGRVHLIWHDRRRGDQIYYRQWNGETWEPEERISRISNRPFTPDVAADSLGRPHAVWMGVNGYNREIWYSCRADTGWVQEIRAVASQPTPVPWRTLVACGPGERVHLIWEDHRKNSQAAIYATTREEGIWGPEERVSDGPANAFAPSVVMDARGTLHVTWSDNRNDFHDIYYRRWSPAGWSLHERVTVDTSDAYQSALAVDARGVLHMAWSDNRDANREIYVMRRQPDVPWDEDPPLPPVPLTLDCWPNPFAGEGRILAQLPSAGDWTLSFFDAQGRLVNAIHQPASRPGLHEFEWDGQTPEGRPLPWGIYYLQLAGNGRTAAGRVLLSRP